MAGRVPTCGNFPQAARLVDVGRKTRVYWFRANVPEAANRGTTDQLSHCWRRSRARRRAGGKSRARGAGLSSRPVRKLARRPFWAARTQPILLHRQTLTYRLDLRWTLSTRWTIIALASPSGPFAVWRKSGGRMPSAITLTAPRRCGHPPRGPTNDWRMCRRASSRSGQTSSRSRRKLVRHYARKKPPSAPQGLFG